MSETRKGRAPDGTAALIFGIIFTVVGGGLLIQRTTGIHVWDFLWRLWPVLLIVMGVKILVDHYGSQSPPKEPQ